MTNKLVLIAIAAGLWANAIASLVRPAHADADSYLSDIAHDIHNVEYDIHSLVSGGCSNSKVCE